MCAMQTMDQGQLQKLFAAAAAVSAAPQQNPMVSGDFAQYFFLPVRFQTC